MARHPGIQHEIYSRVCKICRYKVSEMSLLSALHHQNHNSSSSYQLPVELSFIRREQNFANLQPRHVHTRRTSSQWRTQLRLYHQRAIKRQHHKHHVFRPSSEKLADKSRNHPTGILSNRTLLLCQQMARAQVPIQEAHQATATHTNMTTKEVEHLQQEHSLNTMLLLPLTKDAIDGIRWRNGRPRKRRNLFAE